MVGTAQSEPGVDKTGTGEGVVLLFGIYKPE